jgi:hypothetical protein
MRYSFRLILVSCFLYCANAFAASPFGKSCTVPERWNGINYYSRAHFYNMLNDWYKTEPYTGLPLFKAVNRDLDLLSRNGFNFLHLYVWDKQWGFGVGFNSIGEDPRLSDNDQMAALHEFISAAERRCMFVGIHFASKSAIDMLKAAKGRLEAEAAGRAYAEWAGIFIKELSPKHRNIILWAGPYALGSVADVGGLGNDWNVFAKAAHEGVYKVAKETAPAPELGKVGVNIIFRNQATDGYHYAWDGAETQRANYVMKEFSVPEPDIYMLQLYNANSTDLLKGLQQITGPPTSANAAPIDPKRILVVEFGNSSSLADPPYGMRMAGTGDAAVPSMTLKGQAQWLTNALCAFQKAGINKMAYWTLHDAWNFWTAPPFNMQGSALAWSGYWGLMPLAPLDALPKPSWYVLANHYSNDFLACSTPPEPVISLTAQRDITPWRRSIVLSWTATDVDHMELDQGIGVVKGSIGSVRVMAPAYGVVRYTLTAINRVDGKEITRKVYVDVQGLHPDTPVRMPRQTTLPRKK